MIRFDVHWTPECARAALVADVRAGLGASPKALPPRWFYDERGGRIFERITRLPEYDLSRNETAILEIHAPAIASAARPESLVDLGAGTSEKTHLLLAAAREVGGLAWFVPLDVNGAGLERAAAGTVRQFPGLHVHAVVGDLAQHLEQVPRLGRQLVVLLGSTIGNFEDGPRAALLRAVRRLLAPGDHFLLGVDLVKTPAAHVWAYDDAGGVTADFNRNALRVINRELGADFAPEAFDHRAVFDSHLSRVEMHLVARAAQQVRIPEAGMRVWFERAESLRTEISVKFTRAQVEEELARAGLEPCGWWTDRGRRFGLALAR